MKLFRTESTALKMTLSLAQYYYRLQSQHKYCSQAYANINCLGSIDIDFKHHCNSTFNFVSTKLHFSKAPKVTKLVGKKLGLSIESIDFVDLLKPRRNL